MLVLLTTVLFVFGGNIMNSTSEVSTLEYEELSCFEGARQLVILRDGEINLDNVGEVNNLTDLCEAGVISFNTNDDLQSPN